VYHTKEVIFSRSRKRLFFWSNYAIRESPQFKIAFYHQFTKSFKQVQTDQSYFSQATLNWERYGHGRRRGGLPPPWILKLLAKKVVFSISRGGNWFNGRLAHGVGNFGLIFSRKSSDVCHAEVAISNVITLLTPQHGNSKRNLLPFTIQPKQKACSVTVAANMWGQFFILVAYLACKIVLVCISHSAVQLYTVSKRIILAAVVTKVVRVFDTTTFGGWKHHCNKLFQISNFNG